MKFKYVLIGIGAMLIVLSAKMYIDGDKSKSWAVTKARIISSTVQRITVNLEHSSSSYTPQLKYEYFSNGEKFIGQNIKFGEISFSRKSQAQALIKEYPENSEIDIYYNPNNPSVSVIEPGVNFTKIGMLLCVGLLFSIVGLYFEKLLTYVLNSLKP